MTQLIQLSPLSDFFFGGEATFGQGVNSHYFVRSNLWPQQTSLLGMLRYELLKSEPKAFDLGKDVVINPAEATDLVGLQGFDGKTDSAFGIIEGISPVFLLNPDGMPYFLRSRGFLVDSEKMWLEKKPGFQQCNLLDTPSDTPGKTSLADSVGYQLMRQYDKNGDVKTEPYDGKTDFKETLIGMDGSRVPVEKIFIKIHKTGNRKEYDGAADDSGFFKQDLFRLKNGWRFAFLAAFNTALPSDFGISRKVQLGAERRLFNLSIGDVTPNFTGIDFEKNVFRNFEKLYGNDPEAAYAADLSQLVLLSDAKAEPTINRFADFICSDSASFRHLNSHLQDPNALWNQKKEPKSNRYTLLRRGSAFYAHAPKPIETELNKSAAFRRIGYNYFKTITA